LVLYSFTKLLSFGEGEQVALSVQEEEDIAAVNGEIRFMTLELMKVAAMEGKPFDKVLAEFASNAYKLRRVLCKGQFHPASRRSGF
jgi:hypothetical protein